MADKKTENDKASDTKKSEDASPRAFTQFLLTLDNGDAHEQASQDLQHLLKVIGIRARDSRKSAKGKIVLTVNIVGDHNDVLDVSYDIKLDEPKKRRERTVLWADKNGNFTEKNPRQVELPMGSHVRDVSKRRDVDDAERRDINE
jgi:hypothetical protein